MTPSPSEVVFESHRVGVQFLLTQLEVSRTFLDLAGQSPAPDIRLRHLTHVHSIYTEVQRLAVRTKLLPEERAQIDRALAHTARALTEAGLVVPA